jgi:putative glutamine amidotransferase
VAVVARLFAGRIIVMSVRPVVGIICCNRKVGSDIAQAVMNRYVIACMTYADVSAVLIPSLPELASATDIVSRLDGVLLTGSPSNVDVAQYGEEGEGEGPFDTLRDSMVLRVVDAVLARSMPLLGVCRGFQEINVAFGGTLRRDTSCADAPLKHHAPDGVAFEAMFDHVHDVELVAEGVLARHFAVSHLQVNSVHFQGVGRLGAGLQVEATAPDGLIEAVSAPAQKTLAVQWHPEWDAARNAHSRQFFALFGKAVRGETL